MIGQTIGQWGRLAHKITHFFQNLISFGIGYFHIHGDPEASRGRLDDASKHGYSCDSAGAGI